MSTPEKCRTSKKWVFAVCVCFKTDFFLSFYYSETQIYFTVNCQRWVLTLSGVFWPKSLDCLLFVSHLYVAHSSVLSCDQWGTGFGKVHSAVCCVFVCHRKRWPLGCATEGPADTANGCIRPSRRLHWRTENEQSNPESIFIFKYCNLF